MTDAVSELTLDAVPKPFTEIDLRSDRDPQILGGPPCGGRWVGS
ncbi:MAG: hypothetical protein AB7L28_10870 [Kofleriaceae bacterium]